MKASPSNMADQDYLAFIRQLDAAPFEVTDWEAQFIESIVSRGVRTEKQRQVIDELRAKYGDQL